MPKEQIRNTTPVTLFCLRELIAVGGVYYPIYTGFVAPGDIKRVAIAPSFGKGEHHETIAADVMKPPVKNWQRPISDAHCEQIAATFNSGVDFMPNPVLLSQNASYGDGVTVSQYAPAGATTFLYTITLDPAGGIPLWIIDGQHRITGLAKSILAKEKIPIVLLLNEAHQNVYVGTTLAKIFAQVTTQAAPLRELHNDWLSYAFRLGKYANDEQHYKAMTTTARLASTPTFNNGPATVNNDFFDKIRFNDYLPVTGYSGTPFDCSEFSDFIYKYYFDTSHPHGELSPDEIARQLSLSYSALRQASPQPSKSHCILGDDKHRQDVMRNAFVAAVLAHLASQGVPQSWGKLFTDLKFGMANWDFDSWTAKIGSAENDRSFRIAMRVFSELFLRAHLPPGIITPDLYFRGNNAEFQLITSLPTKKGKYSKRHTETLHAINPSQTVNVVPITNDVLLKLKRVSANAEIEQVEDLDSPRTDPVRHKFLTKTKTTKGLLVETSRKSPLKLNFKVALYGGRALNCEVDVAW